MGEIPLSDWLAKPYWRGVSVRPMPVAPRTICEPVGKGYRQYPVEFRSIDSHPQVPLEAAWEFLALDIQSEARQRGSERVFVGEPESRPLESHDPETGRLFGWTRTYAPVAFVVNDD